MKKEFSGFIAKKLVPSNAKPYSRQTRIIREAQALLPRYSHKTTLFPRSRRPRKKNLAARTAVNSAWGPANGPPRKLERPVARWVPIGVHSRLRSRLARCPVAFGYAAVLTRKPASNPLRVSWPAWSGFLRNSRGRRDDPREFSDRGAVAWYSILPIIVGALMGQQ